MARTKTTSNTALCYHARNGFPLSFRRLWVQRTRKLPRLLTLLGWGRWANPSQPPRSAAGGGSAHGTPSLCNSGTVAWGKNEKRERCWDVSPGFGPWQREVETGFAYGDGSASPRAQLPEQGTDPNCLN